MIDREKDECFLTKKSKHYHAITFFKEKSGL